MYNLQDTTDKVQNFLYQKYKTRSANFIFKSRRMSKELDISPSLCGKCIYILQKKGLVKRYNRLSWLTTFGQQETEPKKSFLKILRNLIKK